MTSSNYDESLRRLLAHEGGYTNHPSDPGGPTKFGITIHDFRKYVEPNATAADVRAMSLGEAKRIYRAKYWDAQRCDDLPAGVDYAVFDYGVNSGIGRSGKVLRRVLKLPDNTSVVTDAVIKAAGSSDAATLVRAICDERLRFLQSLKTWDVFGKGWGRRVSDVTVTALAMAADKKSTAATARLLGRGVVPTSKSVQQATAGAIAVAGAAGAQQAYQYGVAASTVALVLLATAVLVAGGWLFWVWQQQRLRKKAV